MSVIHIGGLPMTMVIVMDENQFLHQFRSTLSELLLLFLLLLVFLDQSAFPFFGFWFGR
jgi:hypothetical protein